MSENNIVTFTEEDLISKKEMREQYIDRLDILEKVRAIFLIPELNLMSTGMVAKFFDVPVETIRWEYMQNKEEIDSDGVKSLSSKDLRVSLDDQTLLPNGKSGVFVTATDGTKYNLPHRSTTYYTPRSVMRLAMLLRDSEVAREVRTRLLDAVTSGMDKQQVADAIEDEHKMLRDLIADIVLSEDQDVRLNRMVKYHDHMNGKILMLESEKKQLTEEKTKAEDALQALTDGARRWGSRETLNALIRATGVAYAKRMNMPWNSGPCIGKMWREFYRRIYYSCGIQLDLRSGKARLDKIKESEWPKVLKTAAALAEENGVKVAQVIGDLNAKEKKLA